MNPLPPNADELVSAYLDGQAAPDEVVSVESSPELMERVEALRTIADQLGEPVVPPVALKEAHISAALDAFDSLFLADAAETAPLGASAPFAVVPPSGEPETVGPELESSASEPTTPPGITSLAAARERRRPLRFNTGIIAAAAAAVILFVAVAAFGFGGGESSLDVASTASEATDTTQAEAASDVADDTEDAAMDDSVAALSEVEARSDPAAAAAAPQAVEADSMEAMADDEAMDEEQAMADDAPAEAANEPEAASDDGGAIDSDAGATADSQFLRVQQFRLFEQDFADQEELRFELEQLSLDDFTARVDLFEPGLFPGCQQDVPELAEIEEPTLVGDALVAGVAIEVHQIIDGDDVTIVLVDPANNCTILPETP